MQNRRVEKTYLALLEGELSKETIVDTPLIRDEKSEAAVKRRVLRVNSQTLSHHSHGIIQSGSALQRRNEHHPRAGGRRIYLERGFEI